MNKQKLSVSEKGYNLALAIVLSFFGILFLGLAIALFVGSIKSFMDNERALGYMLLLFGLFVLIASILLLYLLCVNRGKRGRLNNISSALDKFIK